eukprot:6399-Heterococcus_DN1.PRE.2
MEQQLFIDELLFHVLDARWQHMIYAVGAHYYTAIACMHKGTRVLRHTKSSLQSCHHKFCVDTDTLLHFAVTTQTHRNTATAYQLVTNTCAQCRSLISKVAVSNHVQQVFSQQASIALSSLAICVTRSS